MPEEEVYSNKTFFFINFLILLLCPLFGYLFLDVAPWTFNPELLLQCLKTLKNQACFYSV